MGLVRRGWFALVVMVWGGLPTVVWAGMPSFTLTDAASMRLEVISFFGLAFLACSAVIRWIWNSLRTDFPRLPVLSFRRALGLTFVWGCLFLLVLTMISGARELMTPGAWRKDGLTYKLSTPDVQPSADSSAGEAAALWRERRATLTRLHQKLTRFAREHAEEFPSAVEFARSWEDRFPLPARPGWNYRYAPPGDTAVPEHVLLEEPPVFADGRLGLLLSGRIVVLEDVPASSSPGEKPEPQDDSGEAP
jgi:hypothetical protein